MTQRFRWFLAKLIVAIVILTAPLALAWSHWARHRTDVRLLPPHGVLIAHALGGIDGITYTNSREAFLTNYQDGRRWFEVDLALTRDGDLVCFHLEQEHRLGLPISISKASTRDFLIRRIDGRYTPMTFQQLLGLVKEREGGYLITDTKFWTPELLGALLRDLEAVSPQLRKRLILQCYHPEDLPLLRRAEQAQGPFAGLLFTLYQSPLPDDAVLSFVTHSGIRMVTISTERFSPHLVEALHRLGARAFVHTVNDPQEIARFLKAGADGFYTDSYRPIGAKATDVNPWERSPR